MVRSGVAAVLAVMLVEYLILALPRTVLPKMQAAAFGDQAIMVAALTESIKGFLALVSNLVLGQLSDTVGRKVLLLITVTGTAFPPCTLAFFPDSMLLYQTAVAASGLFAATFSVSYAAIADLEPDRAARLRAYGLAMSTLALSLIIGPRFAPYLCTAEPAGADVIDGGGCRRLFGLLPLLVFGNAVFIYVAVPEPLPAGKSGSSGPNDSINPLAPSPLRALGTSVAPPASPPKAAALGYGTLELFRRNAELRRLGYITAVYYVPVYGVIATLLVYLHRHLNYTATDGANFLGTMGASAVLSCSVLLPMAAGFGIDGRMTVKGGLWALTAALVLFGLGTTRAHFLIGAAFMGMAFVTSPGINALVAASAPAGEQGAAQGGVNGLKALTEGVGPLLFATVFVFFDADSALPGAPYLLGAVLVQYALKLSSEIPSAVPNSPLRPKSTGHLRQEGVL